MRAVERLSRDLARRGDRRVAERARRRDATSTALPAKRRWYRRWSRRRWRGRRRVGTTLIVALMVFVVAVFSAGMVLAVYELIWGDGDLLGVQDSCGAGTACNLFSWGFFALVPIAAAVVWVFLYRLERVRGKYRKYAQEHADGLLDTELFSPVIVGRDDLCDVLQRDLQSRWEEREHPDSPGHGGLAPIRWLRGLPRRLRRSRHRRPIVLVGGVGSGKTAVLARLTQRLAERGAVPVPIRLRAAQRDDRLDLLELARERFMEVAQALSDAEADKIWRRLRDNDQIVVVADGLEEALTSVTDTRETSIRAAFEKIRRENVALIVSSRPHGALKHLDAAMVKLEPLEARAAVEYITHGVSGDEDEDAKDRSRVAGIVRCAELSDMPLFMHIARELFEADRLKRVDARGVDRLGMRVRLIGRWMKLLEEGRIRPAAPVSPGRRKDVIAELEGIAAFGLMHDTLEVTFEDFTETHDGDQADGAAPEGSEVKETLETTTEKLREVAADGERLQLVDARSDGVRFRHSVTQAYLGSERISEVLAQHSTDRSKVDKLSEQLEQSLKHPGRELLMALAMSCATRDERARTRAIRLLLRNVDDSAEKEKAVYTAAAVVAAASASTEQVSDGAAAGALAASAYTRRSGFRTRVILWLTRAEREDAEREAERSRTAVKGTRKALRAAQAEVDEAELKLDDAKREAVRAGRPMATYGGAAGRLVTKRKSVAAVGVARAEAGFHSARMEAARARSKHAEAHAEAAIASAILAEKRLAQGQVQPGAAGSDNLREGAKESVERAIRDVDNSSKERREAARAETEAYVATAAVAGDTATEASEAAGVADRRPVRVPRLAEQVATDVVVAELLLADALGESRPDARRPLLDRVPFYLATVIDAAHDLLPLKVAADSVEPPADDAYGGASAHARARQIRDAARRMADVLRNAMRDAKDDPESGDALRREIAIAIRAVVSARDAAVALKEDRLAEAHACLRPVARELVQPKDNPWHDFYRALRPAALALPKAIQARRALAGVDEQDEQRHNFLERVVRRLRAVSEAVEDAAPVSERNGRPRAMRRATSRTKVLVPLTKMEATDADTTEGLQAAKLDAVSRLDDAAQFVWLWEVCKTEPDAHVRMTAARKLASGGAAAFEHLEPALRAIRDAARNPGGPHADAATEQLRKIGVSPERAYELMGWLLPLLYVSIEREPARGEEDEGHRELLTDWISMAIGISVTSDVALAEGMRFASNHRDLPPAQQGFLQARAEDLVVRTQFWFSKIVLLQAITLWMLSQTAREGRDGTGPREAEDRIAECCKHAGQPFVREAIDLCVKALRRRQPANFVWLDERAVTARLGAGQDAVRVSGTDGQAWIPAAAGWLSLAPRAQRLLGDVVVLMNLLDRGTGGGREEFLSRSFTSSNEDEDEESRGEQQSLPLCLSARGGRAHLDVARELDEPIEPGARCDLAACTMRLCPYPGLGEDLSRGELSEAFCRRQYELVARRRRGRPEWQREATFDELRRFWRAMERRPRA